MGFSSFKSTNQSLALHIWDSGPCENAVFGCRLHNSIRHGPRATATSWMFDSTGVWWHTGRQRLCWYVLVVTSKHGQPSVLGAFPTKMGEWEGGRRGRRGEVITSPGGGGGWGTPRPRQVRWWPQREACIRHGAAELAEDVFSVDVSFHAARVGWRGGQDYQITTSKDGTQRQREFYH